MHGRARIQRSSCGVCACVYVLPGTGPVTAVAITTAAVAYPSTTTVSQLLGGALFTADRKVGEGAERCEGHLNQIGYYWPQIVGVPCGLGTALVCAA